MMARSAVNCMPASQMNWRDIRCSSASNRRSTCTLNACRRASLASTATNFLSTASNLASTVSNLASTASNFLSTEAVVNCAAYNAVGDAEDDAGGGALRAGSPRQHCVISCQGWPSTRTRP